MILSHWRSPYVVQINDDKKCITKCKFCGRDHYKGECPVKDKKCLKCKKSGHIVNMSNNRKGLKVKNKRKE